MHGIKKVKILADKLYKFPSKQKKKKQMYTFTGIEIEVGKSIKAKSYKKNKI